MVTSKSSAAAKTKMLVVLTVALVCLLCFSKNGFSQIPAGKHEPVVLYGNLDTTVTSSSMKKMTSVTWSAVLANTKLRCSEAGYAVTGFTISFLPGGMEFQGPFTISGSDDVSTNPSAKEALAKLSANPRCRVFIENIHLTHNGADMKLSRPLVVSISAR